MPAVTEVRPPHPFAHEPTITQAPATSLATVRTRETRWPTEPLQIVEAVSIGSEPGLDLACRSRVVHAGTQSTHHPNLESHS